MKHEREVIRDLNVSGEKVVVVVAGIHTQRK